MRELSAAEQGTHLDKHKACSNDTRNCDRMLRQVGHHHGDSVRVLKSKALKVGSKMPRLAIERFKGAIHAHAAIRGGMGMRTETRLEEFYEGLMVNGHGEKVCRCAGKCCDLQRFILLQ